MQNIYDNLWYVTHALNCFFVRVYPCFMFSLCFPPSQDLSSKDPGRWPQDLQKQNQKATDFLRTQGLFKTLPQNVWPQTSISGLQMLVQLHPLPSHLDLSYPRLSWGTLAGLLRTGIFWSVHVNFLWLSFLMAQARLEIPRQKSSSSKASAAQVRTSNDNAMPWHDQQVPVGLE